MDFEPKAGELYWVRRIYDSDGRTGPWCMVLCESKTKDGPSGLSTIYSPSTEAESELYGKGIRLSYILVPKPTGLVLIPPRERI